MAESVLDLIDVSFQDATGHTSITSADVLGLVMPYYWGEENKVTIFNRTTFYEMFPESLPMGVKNITNTDLYSAYAQVKAAFAHGAGEVEIYRPSEGWKYQQLLISNTGAVTGVTSGEAGKFKSADTKFDETTSNNAVTVALKHAGFIPQSLAYGYSHVFAGIALENSTDYTDGAMIKLNVYGVNDVEPSEVATDDMYIVVTPEEGDNPYAEGWYIRTGLGTDASPYVYTATTSSQTTVVDETVYCEGKSPRALNWCTRSGSGTVGSPYVYTLATVNKPASGTTYYVAYEFTLLESFEGAASATANIGGESIYLEDIVNGNSLFVDVRVDANVTISADVPEAKFECNEYNETTIGSGSSFTEKFKSGIDKGFKYFRDYDSSICTLIINPFVSNAAVYGSEVLKVTYDSEIKTIAEYRKNCMAVIGYPTNETYAKSNIETYFKSNGGAGSKFCVAVQGREYFSVFGQRFILNCVGGYCGNTINTAKEVRTNQIASGYVYGLYGGSLKESLLSGEAIDLMEQGINSVYTSNRGNLIWGTRTMYGRQTSYFGKINVMRVCTMILKNIFPIAIETLHTDAASNPITRSTLSTMLNSIIDNQVTNQNLLPDSYADCSDAINTDYLTRGGTVLNIILMLHFIGLVERVSIKIIATDTSVTAEFV